MNSFLNRGNIVGRMSSGASKEGDFALEQLVEASRVIGTSSLLL